jgi:hypothetical protein
MPSSPKTDSGEIETANIIATTEIFLILSLQQSKTMNAE